MSPLDDGAGVKRPVIRWYGGKWKLAPWIIRHLPPHRVYVEPYGGGGSVLLRKPRSYAEVWNDLDGKIVNLFRVLRDPGQAARLTELLRLTPFARDEFTAAYAPAEDPIERARRLLVLAYQGFGSNAHSGYITGFRANSNRSHTTPAQDWRNYPDVLQRAVDRLRGVIVESRPAIDVMAQHDTVDTTHYVDPPYVHDTRGASNQYDIENRYYAVEMDDNDHRELLAFLKTLKGAVVLSGYPHPIYDEALAGWRRVTKLAHADGARVRTEVLYIKPSTARTLFQLA